MDPARKQLLLNGLKHLGISAVSVAGAAVLTWLAQGTVVETTLKAAGLSDQFVLAIAPFLHSGLAMVVKTFYPDATNVTPDSGK